MKRKTAHSPKTKRVQLTKSPSLLSIRYVVISFCILLVLLGAGITIKAARRVHVLGTSTGPVLLADQTDQPDQHDTNQPTPPQGGQDQPQTTPSQQQPTPSPMQAPQVTPDQTLVDCVGPDGKHFTTTFQACQNSNQQKADGSFQFTPLVKHDSTTHETAQPEPTETPTPEQTQPENLTVQTEGNKGEVNLQTTAGQIQMKTEDNGAVKITLHKADGTEVQLQASSLDQINALLKGQNVQIAPTSANGFAIKADGVQAETNFPVSVDPLTKTLSVTTPAGTKTVATLPNQAVQNLLQQKVLTNVLSTANQTTPNAAAATHALALTQLNNQLAYAVEGVDTKNLLGFFPVAYQKTVYVSAENGQILQTQQSLLNQVLQFFSF